MKSDDRNRKSIDIYNKIAEKYSAAFDTDSSDFPYIDKFVSYLKPGSNVLDMGCGTGSLTNYIAKEGFKVEGIDLSKSMLDIAKRNYPDIKFELCDIRDMKYPKNTFDGVWAGYSLFHINRDDFNSVLEKIREILKPEGILALAMQEGEGDVEIQEPLLPGEKLPLSLYTKDELEKIVRNAGFFIIDSATKEPVIEGELPFNKILLICKANKE